MSRITEYTSVSAFDENDVLIKDGENGTKIISVEDAAAEFRRLCGINGDISNITDSLSAFGTNLAGVETTFIATKNYNIGDLFVIDNVLYRATATIASGSEIDPETNCEETSFSTVIEAMNDILAGKADANGTYDNLIAGNAKQLAGTVFTEDDAAYTFRTAGGSANIGDREYDEIVGGSIVWNQLDGNTNVLTRTQADITYTRNETTKILHIEGTATGTSYRIANSASTNVLFDICAGHVYLFCVGNDDFVGSSSTYYAYPAIDSSYLEPGRDILTPNKILKGVANGQCYFQFTVREGATINMDICPQVFDLTQMFGSEIADYIYNLEQTTPGAGVAWFRKYFPKTYYEYNAGELMHVSDLQSHDMVGFNLWDEEWEAGTIDTSGNNSASSTTIRSKNYIPIVNAAYRITCLSVSTPQTQSIGGWFYDVDKNYIGSASLNAGSNFTPPSNARYMRFVMLAWYGTTYKNDICINLSWDGERDGEYEPYVKHSYPLDPTLTLRGIPVLSGGNLAYDGDRYKADGTVERRYGIVDLGTLDWNVSSTGSNVFFKNIGAKPVTDSNQHGLMSKYSFAGTRFIENMEDKTWMIASNKRVHIRDSSYSDAESFKAAMSGVYLVYELEEPITETATAYQSPQIVDDFGTEEYVTTSIVPVGHDTKYDSNLRAKLEMAPNSPDGDGDYLVRQTGGQNEYVPYTDGGRITALEGKIPTPPSTDGAYVLKCTVADGTPTYSWVSA